jgi:hypothetical protein
MQHRSSDVLHKQSAIKEKCRKDFSRDEISLERLQLRPEKRRELRCKEESFTSELYNLKLCRNHMVEPSNNDILCGRGKAFLNHEGNKRFRDIVSKNTSAYIKASKRAKRSEVVKAVLNETINTGARFLIRSENKQKWYDGGMKVAMKKVRSSTFVYQGFP